MDRLRQQVDRSERSGSERGRSGGDTNQGEEASGWFSWISSNTHNRQTPHTAAVAVGLVSFQDNHRNHDDDGYYDYDCNLVWLPTA